jgi:signal transduction histidine kinase/ActR/RegA family two-component response regulator
MTETLNSSSQTVLPLDAVLATHELDRRPSRPPDYQSENRALNALAQEMADSPQTVLQALANTILETLHVGSAGISLVTEDGRRFEWPAIAGQWKAHIGGGTPRDFGPCGDVLDKNIPLMFSRFERRYTYFEPVRPSVHEAVLAPFYVAGQAVGTVWAVSHNDNRVFDAEDMRQLVSLARFASSAYQVTQAITQLTEANAKADAANRAKDKFLAVLSHELRTPLTPVMLTIAARQLDPDLSPAMRDDLLVMRRNVELEVKLIDDLLDISRITSGKLRLQVEIVDVNELMRNVCDMCRSNILERGIQLHCEMDAKPRLTTGDPARLQQVFWNLLNNATKFTPHGGQIRVDIANIEDALIRVTVQDSGMGIAPEILPCIFDAFEQGELRITRQFGGMGLGLAISKALVEQHKGSIRAETAGADHGSTFVVELPALSAAEVAKVPSTSLPANRDNDRRLRLLIVEDHADSALVLGKLLRGSGHDVLVATTAAQALTMMGQHPIDIVLSDLGLPDTTGYELMKQIKEQYRTKGIAMSGYGMEDDIRRSEEAGFSDHLVKPMNLAQLEQSIRRVAAESAS